MNSPSSAYSSVGGNPDGRAQGVNVAVPVTLPEGCVGSAEVSVRVKIQGAEEGVCRAEKSREGMEGV